jgi:multiple antibiotic resistance protein
MDLHYFIPTVFFTLFFVVDPLGLIPVFITHLSGFTTQERKKVIIKATLIAISISVFFILLGKYLLQFLSISPGTFLVAGGILLFLISMEMLLGKPSRLKMRDIDESAPQSGDAGDVAVFPLAIPLLCGPGNIAALLLFSSQAWGDPLRMGIIILLSVAVFLIAMAMMFFSSRIESLLGGTNISIIERMIGLILSAMSVQFIIDGLKAMRVLNS